MLIKIFISSDISILLEFRYFNSSDLILIILYLNSLSGFWISTTSPPENLDFIRYCIRTNLLGGRSAETMICDPLSSKALKV